MSNSSNGIFKQVLYAGPDRNERGGIASVIRSYESVLGPINYVSTTNRHSKMLGALRFAMAMASLPYYRMKGVRIVHAHGSVRGSWTRKCMLLAWARFLGMRTVHHIHNGALRNFFARKGEETCSRKLAKADCVVALTNGWARYLSDELGLANTTVIENPVNPPGIMRTHRPDKTIRLVYLSLIDHTKGLFELLETIADHKAELEGAVHLDIGGSGIDDKRMYDFIAQNNLSSIVTTHGWVAGADKFALLQRNDVFILPSYAEGMPVSLLEAMACGLTAIVTPVGGIPEVVTDGINGLLIAPKSKDAIYAAICHFIANPQDIDIMGKRNPEAVKRFYPANIKDKLESMYATILSSGK